MNGSWNCQAAIYTPPWNFKTWQVLNQNRTCMTQVGTPQTVSSSLQLICSPFVESLLVYYDHKLLFWVRTALKADTKAGTVSWLLTHKRQEYSLFHSPLKRTELNSSIVIGQTTPQPHWHSLWTNCTPAKDDGSSLHSLRTNCTPAMRGGSLLQF